MSLPRGPACLAAAALFAACSGAEVHRAPAPAASSIQAAAARSRPPYETPARWVVHPYPPAFASDSMRLADGGCLIMEYSGQRWITHPRAGETAPPDVVEGGDPNVLDGPVMDAAEILGAPPSGCAGDGRAAVERAPEALLGIVRWPGAYGFVGESGVIHVARSPIGPFVRRIPPPEPVVRVRSTGGAVLAVTATGKLLRYTDETGYQRVDLGDVSAVDVATAPAGRAVVLTAPEALFTTEDGGLTFRRASAPSIGVQRLVCSSNGSFVAEGVVTSLAWDPRQEAAFLPTAERISEVQRYVAIRTGHVASAFAINAGRGALDGDRYWEATAGEQGRWTLSSGKLDGTAMQIPLADGLETQGIANMQAAARDRHVALGLMSWEGNGGRIDVRVSHDRGRTFGPSTTVSANPMVQMGLAVSLDGAVLVTGACLRDSLNDADVGAIDDDASCPGGPILLPSETPPTTPRTPSLGGPALLPAFSLDGRHAYFLVGEPNGGRASLFVSHDGGLSFAERSLEVDTDDLRVTVGVSSDTAITVSENGTLGMVMEASGDVDGSVYVTTDADGRNVQIGERPSPDSILGGFGERVLAMVPPRSSTSTAPLSESLDGGKTWSEVPAPSGLREGYYRRNDIACSAAGCVIGEDLMRLGWGAGPDRSVPFEPPKIEPARRPLRTTIACEPRAGSKWTLVDGIENEGLFPDEGDAARGPSAWMLTVADPTTGEVSAVSASIPETSGGESRITKKRLLGPIPKPSTWALAMRPQIEGVSLARMPLGAMASEEIAMPWRSGRVKDLEVAWENLEEGSTGHARIADLGPGDPSTASFSGSLPGAGYAKLWLAMLSISPKGMFVRAHGSREAFFVETSGKVRSFDYPAWPAEILGGSRLTSGDAINVDGTLLVNAEVASSIPGAPELLFLMRPPAKDAKPDAPWTPWATLLAPGADYAKRRFTRTDWTYDGNHLAEWSLHTVPDTTYAAAWLRTLLSDGTASAPQRLPTPYDLSRTPRGCTAAERRTLPRLKFPMNRWGVPDLPGVRHAVLVHEDGPAPEPDPEPSITDSEGTDEPPPPSRKPLRPGAKPSSVPTSIGDVAMITTGLVLRGRGSEACLDAIVASVPADDRRSVLLGGDLSYGWFFRRVEPKPRPGPKPQGDTWTAPSKSIEARPLTCHYAPEATVPTSIEDANQPR